MVAPGYCDFRTQIVFRPLNPWRRLACAVAIVGAPLSASAQLVTSSPGTLSTGSSFLSLSSANVTGGAIYSASTDFGPPSGPERPTQRPISGSPSISTASNWIAVGGGQNNNGGGSVATLSLAPGTTAISFLWGTPDVFNTIKVNTSAGSQSLSPETLFSGSFQTYGTAGYVTLRGASPTTTINSIEFGTPAGWIEISNVTAVPEPGTYAMLLSGLAAVGWVTRRRGRAQVPTEVRT